MNSRLTPLYAGLLFSCLFMTMSVANAAALPEGATVTGPALTADGTVSSSDATNVVIQGKAPHGATALTLIARTGGIAQRLGDLGLFLKGSQEKPLALGIGAYDYTKYRSTDPNDTVADAYLRFGSNNLYFKPNPNMFQTAQLADLKPQWRKLPGASQHWFTLRLQPLPSGQTGLWVDGIFLQPLDISGPFSDYTLRMRYGAQVRSLQFDTPQLAASRVTLDVSGHPRSGPLNGANLTLNKPDALPLEFAGLTGKPVSGINCNGLGRIPGLGSPELWSLFWQRNETDDLPDQRMFNVPLENYSYAQVLCAADLDPATENAFTLRVTRYGSSRGNTMADTQVVIPNSAAQAPENAHIVGKLTGADGHTTPLWLIRVPVKNGLVQDLIQTDKRKSANLATPGYLDVEFLDPLVGLESEDRFPPSLNRSPRTYAPAIKPGLHIMDPRQSVNTLWPTSSRSGVTVLAAFLERAPAALVVRPNTAVNVFMATDRPQWQCAVHADVPGHYTLQWDFADVDSKVVTTGKTNLDLTTRSEASIAIPVNVGNGWYATRFRLQSALGELCTDQRGSFVFLPPDTRKAGFESPFTAWWFADGYHGDETNIDRVGPFLQRAGIRHTGLTDKLPESLTTKYGLTNHQVIWQWPSGTIEESLKKHEALLEKWKALWPSVKTILVWHEGGPGYAAFPVEMWGGKPSNEADRALKEAEAWKARLEYATALAKMVREKYPDYQLQYGNDGASLFNIASMGRNHFPQEYVDTIATETVGQGIAPENATPSGLQALWFLKETARKVGYPNARLSACFEWIDRPDLELGRGRQAQWYVRDALHALAYGLPYIPLGGVQDAGDGYYYSLWGNGGLAESGASMNPKPCYAAMATLTRLLDQAQFLRTVPTGSLGVYALEFKVSAGYVYAMWAPRGLVNTTIKFASGASRTLTDLYGRENARGGTLITLSVGPDTHYISSKEPAASITTGAWKFPEDPVPAHSTLVDAMADISHWKIPVGPDANIDRPGTWARDITLPLRVRGNFDMHIARDPEKGDCLEVALKPQGELWADTNEYAVLTPVNPVAPEGKFSWVGVWVKGNGSQGDIMWKLENAQGQKWSTPTDYQDWPGHNKTNYDGWRFLSTRLPDGDAWRTGVKVTGLAFTIPRQTLYLTKMVPVPNQTLRFKGLCLY